MPTDQNIQLAGQTGASHVFTTIAPQRGEVQTIDLRPNFISLGLPPTAFKPEFRGVSGRKIFDAAVGGGRFHPGVVWFFMGENYVRYTLPSPDGGADEISKPQRIDQNWAQGRWPYSNHVDAGVSFTSQPTYLWFFQNNTYIRYNLESDILQDPSQSIAGNWPGWPAEFDTKIDAAIEGRDKFEGMAWFFKGPQYIRYNDVTVKGVDIPPTPIASVWKGWPASFDRVDCAFYGTGTESRILYFLRADEYIAYDLQDETVMGPPQPIATKFPKLAIFTRRPQLFLREQIQLTTYYGDITAGEIRADSHGMDPGSEQTYTVVVESTTTSRVTDTMTVLESQNQALVDDVNTSMQDEANESHDSEKYDYNFKSSFEGEMDYTGFGGDVNANLNFEGGSNNVRQGASKASMNAIRKQVSRTEENRRQTSRVVSGEYTSTSRTESAFTRKVVNNTDKPVNIGVFQLEQHYIALAVLTDVQIAFSNKDEPVFAKIEQLDTMLSKYIADPSQVDAIEKAVLAELQQVADYQDTPVSVIKDLGNGRFKFDSTLKSKFQLTNVDGTPRRQIEVEGVILKSDKFKVLTPAVLLTELSIG